MTRRMRAQKREDEKKGSAAFRICFSLAKIQQSSSERFVRAIRSRRTGLTSHELGREREREREEKNTVFQSWMDGEKTFEKLKEEGKFEVVHFTNLWKFKMLTREKL